MKKFKGYSLFLSLVLIISSSNLSLSNAQSKNDFFNQQDDENCRLFNSSYDCDQLLIPPITAAIMGAFITSLHYITENNIIKNSPLIQPNIFYNSVRQNQIGIVLQEGGFAASVGALSPASSSFVSPDPLISSVISKFVSSIPASSTIVSSPLASGSYSSYNASFLSKIPSALSVGLSSSPVLSPASFSYFFSFFPKQDSNKIIKTDYRFALENYRTRKVDFEFNSVVTFGDSLSDSGTFGRNSVYMADGDIYNLYNTLLSEFYTGKPNAPYNQSGVNYASSGSIITAEGISRFDINYFRKAVDDQISWYLKDFGDKADPNSIYIYWAGGNDLANKLSLEIPQKAASSIFSFNPKENFNKIFDQKAYFSDKELINKMVKSVGRLLDYGAGYVYFLNLPASGYAPFTQMLLEGATFGSVDIIIERFPLVLLSPNYWLSKVADDYLRNPLNHIGDPKGRGKDYIIENNVASLKHRYFFLPTSFLKFYYNFAADIQNAFIRQFNNEVKRQLSSINYKGNIIYADVDALFTEIMDNYQDYGIDEVLVPQCQLGLQSTSCNATDARYHNDKVYAFTDWHHPSNYSHLMIAQYMQSILDAPVYISSLTRNLENVDISRRDFLNGELSDFRNKIYNSYERLIPIVGYSGLSNKLQASFIDSKQDYTNILHVGVAYLKSSNLLFGFLGSFGFGKQNPHNEINFKQNNESLTLFGQLFGHNSYLNMAFSGGIYNANSINRVIVLGNGSRAGNRVESGSTKGRFYNLNLKTGYNFDIIEDYLIVSPNIGYSTSKYKINAYEENNNLSTSMKFGKQKSASNILYVGMELLTHTLPINAAFEINYNHSLNSKDLIIDKVGIKSTDLIFSRSGMNYKNGKSKDWINISPRVNFKVGENTFLHTNIFYQFDLKGKRNNSRLNYSLGLKSSF